MRKDTRAVATALLVATAFVSREIQAAQARLEMPTRPSRTDEPPRAGRFQTFERVLGPYRENLDEAGIGFILGGALGTALSLTLAARSTEPFSKLGLSTMAGASTLAMFHGVTLFVRGDALTREADALERMDLLLERAGVDAERRARAMDRIVLERLVALRAERDDVRFWNGLLGLGAAVGGGIALGTSHLDSTTSQVGLGLFTLATGVYGLASLIPVDGAGEISQLVAHAGVGWQLHGPAAVFVVKLP